MKTRFEHFESTALGQKLAGLLDTRERYIEFRAFSREGFPAVTALVSVLTPVLEPLRTTNPSEFDAAKQYCGWKVGVVMRRQGHEIVRKSARVPGKLFNVAAVWGGPFTTQMDEATTLAYDMEKPEDVERMKADALINREIRVGLK